MFLKSLFSKKKSNNTTIDANNLLETMSDEEIVLIAPMLCGYAGFPGKEAVQ